MISKFSGAYANILDLHLPGPNGVDILNFIKAEKRLACTQVIVVTADRLSTEQVRETADFVLVKPISFAQLQDLTIRLHSIPNAGPPNVLSYEEKQ